MIVTFQVMPPLSAEEYAALRDDIVERGIMVPVVVDQHGRLLDGHHRRRIAVELQIDCPVEVRQVADDEDARTVAFTLNIARRHLTREQKRELIAREVGARPGDSDRAIARRLGCSPSTVAAVRRPVSNLDTSPAERARALAEHEEHVQMSLDAIDESIARGYTAGIHPLKLIGHLAVVMARLEAARPGDEEFLGAVRRHIVQPRIDALLGMVTA